MSRHRQLHTLKTLADAAEQESSRTLAARRDALDAEINRLEQLRRYLDEYGAAGADGKGVFADSIRTRRDFLARLCDGIEEQERVVARLQQQLDQDLQHWRDARSHALALERYGHRLQAAEDEKDARREQARLDEVGRQQHLARSA